MDTSLGTPTTEAIAFFLVISGITLAITYWAARRTRAAGEGDPHSRTVTALQNGLALSGDYMSAASFLGIAGMVALQGYDGMIYATGWLVGWPALMFLVAEPLRNLGMYTFTDVVAFRLRQAPVRIASAVGGVLTVLFYAIAQMVGSGHLIKLMFGISYESALIIVGAIMLLYVLGGGMVATTWVQIIKAVLLLGGVTILAAMVMSQFSFNPGHLYSAVATRYGQAALEPGGLVANGWDTISLGIALMLGLLGLPHILMRFCTVPDARTARTSVLYATGFIGYFYLIIPIVGFGAAALVGRGAVAQMDKGGNMAALLLAETMAGTPFLGFMAAVAFATILAVVGGLTLAGASAISRDVYAHVIKKGTAPPHEELRVARWSTVVFGIVAVLLGVILKDQNVAYLVGLAFAIACSANFPALLLSITWRKFTTAGAVASILTGSVLAVLLIILSPTIQVDVLGHASAYFPLRNPAIVSMSVSFAVAIVVSLVTKEESARTAFDEMRLRTYLGVDAE